MAISIDGIKQILSAVWKSLPTEILLMLSFLVGLTALDFLPAPILSWLGSATAVASFGMLFGKMFRRERHEYVIAKAVREAEKKYITDNYENCRNDYIPQIKAENKTVLETVKENIKVVETPTEAETEIETEAEVSAIKFP